MSEWQKCPVCDGTGLVSRPPYISGDVWQWNNTGTAPYPCKVCNGIGVLIRPEEKKPSEDETPCPECNGTYTVKFVGGQYSCPRCTKVHKEEGKP